MELTAVFSVGNQPVTLRVRPDRDSEIVIQGTRYILLNSVSDSWKQKLDDFRSQLPWYKQETIGLCHPDELLAFTQMFPGRVVVEPSTLHAARIILCQIIQGRAPDDISTNHHLHQDAQYEFAHILSGGTCPYIDTIVPRSNGVEVQGLYKKDRFKLIKSWDEFANLMRTKTVDLPDVDTQTTSSVKLAQDQRVRRRIGK